MKMKKLLAAVLAAAMALALAPGLAVAADGAEAPAEWFSDARYYGFTMEDWHELATDQEFEYKPTATEDGVLSENYSGWSATWSKNNSANYPDATFENNNFTSKITNINTYGNSYQVYGAAGSKDTVNLPGYGKGKKFVILEFWHTRDTYDFKHEFAIKDTKGKIIETGYVRRGSSDIITDGLASGKTDSFESPVPADEATTGVKQPVKISTAYNTGTRIVFVNNDDNTYSVIYYIANGFNGTGELCQINEDEFKNIYQPMWRDDYWDKMYTATYNGQFDGIGSIEYAVPSASLWYRNHRVNYLRIYSGNIERSDYTVTISGAGEHDGVYTYKARRSTNIPAPHFDGYVLKARTAGDNVINTRKKLTEKTLSLEYAPNEESLGTWAVRNNVTGTTAFNKMKLLGSHDSFTYKMEGNNNYRDEAGILYGDLGSKFGFLAANMSKAQSKGVLDQINSGARYFDVRLSRQEDGALWTRHGIISEDFEGIAYTLAQFAEENPGEVIVLDFQSTWDDLYDGNKVVTNDGTYFGGTAGDDNKYVYNAICATLQKTGLADYVVGNVSLSNSYDELTNKGTKAAVICFAKARGANCINRFINRNVINGVYKENSNYSNIVDYINSNYNSNVDFQIIHAFTTGSNLISDAQTNNPKFIEESNFQSWMEKSNIIILDDVINSASAYLAKLSEYTRDGFDGVYTAEAQGVKVEGPSAGVPFSTKLTAEKSGKDYTFNLTQFSGTPADIAGGQNVSLTFPDATGGIGGLRTVVYKDGEEAGSAESGKDVVIDNVTRLNGVKYTVTTEAADGTADAKLGYDGANLTVDFLLGGLTGGITGADSFKVTVIDPDGNTVGEGALTAEKPNVLLTPGDSNAIYTAAVEAVKNGAAYSVGSVKAALYSEVVENLTNLSDAYNAEVNNDMIAKANAVITHGGVYFTDGEAPNGDTASIVDVDTDTDAAKITVTVKEPYKSWGIGFLLDGNKVCVGSIDRTFENAEAGKVYGGFTIDRESGTLTLSGGEALTLSLDAVNIEYVLTLVDELETGGADQQAELEPLL